MHKIIHESEISLKFHFPLAQGWNGTQIIPAYWIEKSIRCYSPIGQGGYGYMWWLKIMGEDSYYFAAGTGGQYLIVVPKQELVIVNRVDTGKRVNHGYSLKTIIWYLLFLLGRKFKGQSLECLLQMILTAKPS